MSILSAITSLDILFSSVLSLFINLVYAAFTTVLALGILWGLDRYLFKKIDFIEEIQNGNLAAAVFAGFFLLSICLILSFTMR
ncbi:MAG: DUF350 domain-containing protein [Opitutaceae bacterium]|nr:DUF350 domain-containing protein [Opitutaceae bacterium]